MRRTIAIAIISLAAGIVSAAIPNARSSEQAPFVIESSGKGFWRLQEAVTSIRDGDATILIAPGTYHDCAVQQGGRITFRARQAGTAIFDGTACEGKAVLVLRGRGSRVDGLVFRHIRVADGNGAGIRTEMGDLAVSNAMFLDSQEGILGGQPTDQRISIDHSTFSGLGQCDETTDCSHSIYLANQGSVTITNSRFERGTGGHYVKLRVPEVTITDNSFDDSRGHKTNYMIDLSEGASGTIARNIFVQGPDKENWTGMIVVAAEAQTYSSAGLRVVNNRAALAPGQTHSPAFVATTSRQRIDVADNDLGQGIRRFEQR
ncbi:right-handed parallel beta-helix repeat-containing protein [Stakelama sp. CBK3Z-3]|uniref:Right-handed parallel beta-helix repeat-containing protein n=1 Tax=Stakelama flava TaxID=2860338 RepID=A0ABS6XHR8_9SPHN|nr:right-handed parallel beta-helix repeat-containing protein [Stakelama flava]MBW4329774.1 right-handed parallel beta-helix repeat-containing protein [Stakelama flava]